MGNKEYMFDSPAFLVASKHLLKKFTFVYKWISVSISDLMPKYYIMKFGHYEVRPVHF